MKPFLLLTAFICFSMFLCAQIEQFDIAAFKAPSGWKKEVKQTMVVYTKIQDAAFCILGVYQSRSANGTAETEFNTEWQKLMVENAGVKEVPAIDRDKADGWELYIGKAKSRLDNGYEYMNVLTTFIGYGKVVSFVINYNDDRFKKDISDFFDNIKIAEKSDAPAVPKTIIPQIPLKASAKLKGDIAGIWMGYENGDFTDDHFIDDYNNEPALASGSGTYQIIDYTLILNYSDGREVQRCFFGFLNEDPKNCKVYYLNNQDIKLKPKE